MSLTVIQRPSIAYNSQVSRWNAVRNPVVYKMQRKDFVFNQVNNSGGFVQLQFNGVNLTSSFANGDSVYVQSDNGEYNAAGLQTAEAFSAGNTLITTDIPYTNAAPGGFLNNFTLRLLYRIEVEVYNSDNVLLTESPFTYTPTYTGSLLIDISSQLKSNLIADISADLSEEVIDDTNAYIGFYIKYTEVWTGSAESQTNDSSNQFYAALSALQIPALYGGNMAIYAVPEIKFLTKLDRPVMWRGYPFFLSAIISDDIAADVFISTANDESTPDDYSGKLIHFNMNEVISDQTPETIDAAIYESGSSGDKISETLTIELRDVCENPVMLVGRNSLGGVLQWMFDINQEYTFDFNDGVKSKRLTLFTDDLTINQWEALNEFFTLGEVYRNNILELTSSTIKTSTRIGNQVYVVDDDGTKTGVIVIPKERGTQTRQVKHSFEIEIEFPETFA